MANRRLERISDLLREVLAEKIRTVREPALHQDGVLVSITRVEVTSDLSYARVGISVLGQADQQHDVLAALERAAGFLRREVNREVRLRKVPELRFELDGSLEGGERVLRLLEKVVADLPEEPQD